MAAMEARKPRLLLHACCGPCLIAPADVYTAEHEVTVAYANPNIHPRSEYVRRRDTLFTYAASRALPVIELAYEPAEWARCAGPAAGERPARCRACYGLRLEAVADHARSAGFDAFATTLTVSPYQDHEALRQVGEATSARCGVAYVHRDLRPAFRDAQRRAQELGMYRQRYCGCLLSAVEADRDRAAAKAARRTKGAATS